ncbi:hypothetical protein [Murimonas intestini]
MKKVIIHSHCKRAFFRFCVKAEADSWLKAVFIWQNMGILQIILREE